MHTHIHAHARAPHTPCHGHHTHARTHTHTHSLARLHARTHARMHTHTCTRTHHARLEVICSRTPHHTRARTSTHARTHAPCRDPLIAHSQPPFTRVVRTDETEQYIWTPYLQTRLPLAEYASHLHVAKGQLKADYPGCFLLVFDNTFSRWVPFCVFLLTCATTSTSTTTATTSTTTTTTTTTTRWTRRHQEPSQPINKREKCAPLNIVK